MPTKQSHNETMVKRTIRADIGLLRYDWFDPVQAAAIDKALVYVGAGYDLDWRTAAGKALRETYAEFKIEGLFALTNGAHPEVEAGADETGQDS